MVRTPKTLTREQALELAAHYTLKTVEFMGRYLEAERDLDGVINHYKKQGRYKGMPKLAKKAAKADPAFGDCVDDLGIYARGIQMTATAASALYQYADHLNR